MKGLLIFSALISLPVFGFTSQTFEFDAIKIKSLKIKNTSGLVRISSGGGDKATVVSEKVKFSDQCQMEAKMDGSALEVEVSASGQMNASDCEVNLTLTVPRIIGIHVENGIGAIEIFGTEGEVVYKVGSGSVTVDAQVMKLDGQSGSGEARLRGLVGSAAVRSGFGDVSLVYTKAPSAGELEVTSGSGNTHIFLPSDSKIMTSTVLGTGSTLNEIGNTQGAGFKVMVKAGHGDLNIKTSR